METTYPTGYLAAFFATLETLAAEDSDALELHALALTQMEAQ